MRRPLCFVVPEGVDDPDRVSGGNLYDRRLREGLRSRGWDVRMLPVADREATAEALSRIGADAIVMIDGLVAGWAPDAVEGTAARLPVVIVAHMVSAAFAGSVPDLVDAENRALRSAGKVIATSGWTAGELVRLGLVNGDRIAVAQPGSRGGSRLPSPDHRAMLCVGAIAPHKGQDVLLQALGLLDSDGHRGWTCTLVGSHTVDAEYAARVAETAAHFSDRVRMPGILHGTALDREYRRAGLLVAPSRVESFGMAVADARRRGLPMIASAVGGIPEAAAGGGAMLVSPDDPRALAGLLARWMAEPAVRSRLNDEAAHGRAGAPRWADTVERVDRVLESV
ncbi:MAG TPA: glycosyltransferase family 4 protein [Pseudolysinimonas sp.]